MLDIYTDPEDLKMLCLIFIMLQIQMGFKKSFTANNVTTHILKSEGSVQEYDSCVFRKVEMSFLQVSIKNYVLIFSEAP